MILIQTEDKMALTGEQQARIDVARKRVSDTSDAYNRAAMSADAAGEDANWCKALRDAKSTGIGKNNACHIDELTRKNAMWQAAINERDTASVAYQEAKINLDRVLASIEVENKLAADSLKADPKYNLQTQQNILASDKLQNESEKENNKKKVVIISVISLLLIIIVSLFIYFKRSKSSKNA